MALDEQHVALPKLYGAPAYSRPSRPVEVAERPLDPDDLPIAAFQTDEEREIAETLAGRPYAPGGGAYVESACSEADQASRSRGTGVASRRGSSSMVRAVGLYPAGSRFESWLPYHSTTAGR